MTNLPGREGGVDLITFAASQTIDFDAGLYNHKSISAMTGNWTPSFASSNKTGIKTFKVTQHVSGQHSVTWPGNIDWLGADPQPSLGSSAETIFQVYWTGTEFLGINARNARVIHDEHFDPGIDINVIDTWFEIAEIDSQHLPLLRGDLIQITANDGVIASSTVHGTQGTTNQYAYPIHIGTNEFKQRMNIDKFEIKDESLTDMTVEHLKIIRM